MNKRSASALLVAPTIVLSYLICLIADQLPVWECKFWGANSLDDVWAVMPDTTRFAVVHAWMFPMALAIISLGSATLLWRVPQEAPRVLITGLCLQGIVGWSAMFCLCYDYFTGPMCLHHGPEFEIDRFITFGLGAFPVSFAAIVAPLVFALFPRRLVTS